MRHGKRFLNSLVMAAFLAAPMASVVAAQPQEVNVKVYDKDHNDYHTWDDKENKAWGSYLDENHKKPHDYKKADKKEQSDYWNWRHAHPDQH